MRRLAFGIYKTIYLERYFLQNALNRPPIAEMFVFFEFIRPFTWKDIFYKNAFLTH